MTSSDDELELSSLDGLYHRTASSDHITRFEAPGRYFYVLPDGNAINFLHGAAVGTYIHLIQAEIITATAALTQGQPPGLHELTATD